MSNLIRFKSVFKKLAFTLTFLPSILLVLGCIFIFYTDNFVSFGFSLIIPILLVLNIITGVYWIFKKNKLFLLSLFCGIIYFLCFDSFYQFNKSVSSDLNSEDLKLSTLSILTFNSNGFKQERDKEEQIVDFIKNNNPDVICFQEFSAIKFKYFIDTYPHWYKTNIVRTGKSVMAIFSKYPIVDKGYINFPDTYNGGMYVDLDFNDKISRIYNLHFESFKFRRNFYNFSEVNGYNSLRSRISKAEKMRKEQVLIIKKHIDDFKGKVVICGDFNSTQFSSAYKVLKASKKDSFIEAGFGLGKTYNVLNYPFRLDYILVDDSIKVLSHQNFDIKLSDHEPILAKLVVN